jgi:hypothetical protein
MYHSARLIKMSPNKALISILLIVAIIVPTVQGIPSGGGLPPSFTYNSGEWYDDWGITRTYAEGSNGYLPLLLAETIGDNSEQAYSIGQRLQDTYSDRNTLATKILKYVQTWVEYGYDSDNVFMNGVAQEEWAWNADELAHSFDTSTGQVAVGDCEDMSFLGATIYEGAGFETAIIDAPGHVALLIWLPDFQNANQYWDLDDGRGAGWIWVEATGSSNPLGWTPPDFSDGGWTAYTHVGDTFYSSQPYSGSTDGTGGDGSGSDGFDWNLIILIVVILFIMFTKSRR